MPFKCLLVDDDRGHTERVRTILVSLGAEVTAVPATRLEAIPPMRDGRYELIILQTDCSELPGLSFLPEIRRSFTAVVQTPVVGTSVATTSDEFRALVRAGFATVLTRPVQAGQLREVVYQLDLSTRPIADAKASISLFRALSNPARLTFFLAIARHGQATAATLAEAESMSRQRIDFHLKALRKTGLLRARRQGRQTLYSVQSEGIESTAHWMLQLAGQIQTDARGPT